MATVLQFFLLARHLQRLESFVTDITEVNHFSLLCFVPHTDPIQQQHDFPHKPALDTCRSRRQKMSTPLHGLPKADACLEGDVADDKADPLVCLQLHQIFVLQYFLETAGSIYHRHVLTQAIFLEVLATVVALFWQTGKGAKWQVSWCLRRPQIIQDVGSVCISTKWLFNFFLVKRNLKQELQVKETCGKRESNQLAILQHKAVLHYTLSPLPLHLLLIIIILLLFLLNLLMLLFFKEVWKASRLSLLSCRDLQDRHCHPPSPG